MVKRTVAELRTLVASVDALPLDLLFSGVIVVDVVAHELRPAQVGVRGDTVVYVGDEAPPAIQVVAGRGRYLAPGLMNAHMHIESSMLSLPEFARAVMPLGTTAVFADPHEIANVFGMAGVRLFLDHIHNLPLRVYLQVPSRVPNAPDLEGSGGALSAEETNALLDHPASVSLGEIPVSLTLDPQRNARILEHIAAAHARRLPINGHAPATGKQLAAFVSTGANDDHTCISLQDGIAKIRNGMWIMIKESSLDRNLEELYPLLQRYPHRVNLCTDDYLPNDLLQLGFMDHLVRKAIRLGVDPLNAIAAATFNVAQRHHLEEYVGSVAPGRLADLVLLSDLTSFSVDEVYVGGQLAARDGQVVVPMPRWDLPAWATDSVRVPALSAESFLISAERGCHVRTMEVVPLGGARNRAGEWNAPEKGGYLRASEEVNHLSVVNRYGQPRMANAFCRGFHIKGGAIAGTVAHDHHNLVTVGDDPRQMLLAAEALREMRGGLVVVREGGVAAALPLPIAGLMSLEPLGAVAAGLSACNAAARAMGCPLAEPFISLAFVGLPTMPDYGLTDRGLVDVHNTSLVPVVMV